MSDAALARLALHMGELLLHVDAARAAPPPDPFGLSEGAMTPQEAAAERAAVVRLRNRVAELELVLHAAGLPIPPEEESTDGPA